MKKLSTYLLKVSIGLLFTIQAMNLNAQDTIVVFKTTDPDMFLYNYNYVDSLCDPEMFGTLQWAIRKLNDSPNPCVIVFAIPGSGQHIINMNYELPAISKRVTIDGTSQEGYVYGTPSVIINGTENIPQCFSFYSYDLQHRSDSCIIKGLQIQNFYISGLMLFNSGYCQILDNVIVNITNASPDMATMGIRTLNSPANIITGNFIGTNSTLDSGFGCDNYGIYIQTFITIPGAVPSSYYIIGDTANGKGNVIAYNGTVGIIMSQDCWNNRISGNKIFNNPIGISLIYGANQNKQAPVITSATNSTVSGTSAPNDIIEIFGCTGNENANEYLATTQTDVNGNWTTSINTTYSNVIATATDSINNTSMLSNAENIMPNTTKLIPADCGATNIAFGQALTAISIPNATTYTFFVSNNNLNFFSSIDKNVNIFTLEELNSNLLYNMTYEVRVKVDNGQMGEACTITTATEPIDSNYVRGQLFIKIWDNNATVLNYNKDSTSTYNNVTDSLLNFINDFGIKKIYCPFILNNIKLEKTYVVEFDSIDYTPSLIEHFQPLTFIEYSEKVPLYKSFFTPNDFNYGAQWALHKIRADLAWNVNSGNNVVVAVVDNAIDIDHFDLAANIWTNPGDPTYNGIDEDNNGITDDVQGADVAYWDNNPRPTIPPIGNNPLMTHGTHVAGIVGAETNNNIGVASIGNHVKIMPVKIGNEDGTLPTAYLGVQYAIDKNAKIINMSWGGPPPSQTYQYLFDIAFNNGIICVAASGNSSSSSPMYPASYNHVISVGATDASDHITYFSNFGTDIDVMAPGQDILSTFPSDQYASENGTSMASPLVAGLCALMISQNPTLSPDALEACLKSSCTNIYPLNPAFNGQLGAGRIDAYAALACLTDEPLPDFTSSTQYICSGNSINFYDNSLNSPTTWTWTFAGGIPSTSTVQNPIGIIYNTPGTYNVTLTISNLNGTHTLTKNNYIIIGDCPPIQSDQGIWNFGLLADLDFSSGSPQSVGVTQNYSWESCASQSDIQGNLLFYTTGTIVWDANHTIIANNLNASPNGSNSNSQGVVIVPNPGNIDEYYIFTSCDAPILGIQHGLNYTPVNISSGLAQINPLTINTIVPGLNPNTSEFITAIPHCNGTDYWIIVKSFDDAIYGDKILSYRLTPSGFDPTVIVSDAHFISTWAPTYQNWRGYIEVSKDGKKVVFGTGGSSYIYDFNSFTGELNYLTQLPNGHRYTCFSPSGEFLYAPGNSTLIQYDLRGLNECNTNIPYFQMPYSQCDLYQPIQSGPDDKIYTSGNQRYPLNNNQQNSDYLSVINFPDNLCSPQNPNACGLAIDYYHLGLSFNGFQSSFAFDMPNFIDAEQSSYQLNPEFEYCIVNCSEVHFHAFGCGTVDGWDYDASDGLSLVDAGLDHTVHTYPVPTVPTTYTVTLQMDGIQVTHDITIAPPPVPQIIPNNDICEVNYPIEYTTDLIGLEYQWSVSGSGIINGTSNNQSVSITWNAPGGTINLTVTDPTTGCSNNNTADIVVHSQPIPVISSNTTICYGNSTQLSLSGGVSCFWLPSTGLDNPMSCMPNASPTVTTTYTGTTLDAFGCAASTSVTITIYPQITSSIVSTDVGCSFSCDGTATVTPQGGLSPYTYLWNPSSQNTSTAINLCTGNYSVTVTDANNCSITNNVTINNVTGPVITLETITDSDPCCNGSITLTPELGVTYTWSNAQSGATILNLCPNNYTVTATATSGCTSTQTFTINSILPPSFLYPCSTIVDVYVGSPLLINGQTFDFCGQYIVHPGALLTINSSTIHFTPGSGITVLSGGTLKIKNNSTLTSFCNEMWNGIYAIGSATAANPVSNTWLTIDDSYIENAIRGVDANVCVLRTSNSHYINNSYDLYLRYLTPYPYSIIESDHFITTSLPLLPPANKPFNHIIFNNPYTYFNSVHINLCEFDNQEPYTLINMNDRGNGIISFNTRTEITNSTFTRLQYGISTNSNTIITGGTFNDNNRGVMIQSTSSTNSEVHNNTFNVGNNGYLQDNLATLNWGLAFYNCPVFDVYENTFNNGLIGVLTNFFDNTGGNIVYNNVFNNMYSGIVSTKVNNILFNCNRFGHTNFSFKDFGQYQSFEGGDIVIYSDHAFLNQTMHGNLLMSTYNALFNTSTYCSAYPLNSLKFFNNVPSAHYDYKYCNDFDVSDIRDCDATIGGTVSADFDPTLYVNGVIFNCPSGDPGGNKSMSKGFISADSLSIVKEYQVNVLQSLTDNGNTAQFLASIAILAPNNFTKFYNKLIASSPFLSDTVLIAFMTHPINKPAQKKAIVLANSPLPYRVRPYINQMNVNQNFKNQMWAAQTGSSNAKVQLENYISWLGNRRQQEINALAVNCNKDTLGFERDSLINYLNNSVILNDHIIRYNLLIDKSDYSNATAELPEINSLTSDLSIEKQQEYIEFAEVAGIFMDASQLSDSSADSLILANQAYLETIAGTELHLAQSDAKTLLEKAGIAQQYLAYLPDGITTKSFRIPDVNDSEISESCESLTVYPNPSNGNMFVKYNLGDEESIAEIMLTATDGKIINSYKLLNTKGEIQINCNTCISGNYILTLYVDGEKQCSKELNIKK